MKSIDYLKLPLHRKDRYYTFDSEDLIKECKADILEFGAGKDCALQYKIMDNGEIVFTDYSLFLAPQLELADDPFDYDQAVQTTLKRALELFEDQNRILE